MGQRLSGWGGGATGRGGIDRSGFGRIGFGIGLALAVALGGAAALAAPAGDVRALLGTWHGTSTCVNRELAPACKDEVVVYEVRRGDTKGVVTLKADKIVDGKRVTMGETDFAFDAEEHCWRSEVSGPNFHGAWCLTVEGDLMIGGLHSLPEQVVFRKVRLTRDHA